MPPFDTAGQGADYETIIQSIAKQLADERKFQVKNQKRALALEYKKLKQIGVPQQQLDEWWRRQQIDLAKMEFGLKEKQFAEGQRQFDASHGLDVLKTAAQLRGPQQYFQYLNFMDQVAGGPQAEYLKPYAGMGNAGNVASLGAMAQQGTGGGGAERTAADIFHAGNVRQLSNPYSLPTGFFENMGSMEAGLRQSSAGAGGLDWGDIMDRYKSSRWATGNPLGN